MDSQTVERTFLNLAVTVFAVAVFGFCVNGPTIFADTAENPGIALGVSGSDRSDALLRLNAVAGAVQKAYAAGNEDKVQGFLDDGTSEAASRLLLSLSKTQLKEIGEAFRTRRLAYFGNTFARFSYSLRGKKCIESFRHRPDGSWAYFIPQE
ncbi:MAG: hypothetical protein WA705_13135 [Candidatus Ozemobacteraceae bacterium]